MNTLFLKFMLFIIGTQVVSLNEATQQMSAPAPVDPKMVLEQIKMFYSSNEDIYHELRYDLFADHTATTAYSSDQGVFIKHGNVQYSQLATIESLTTTDYTIGIDHDEKMVMISNHISLPATGPLADTERWAASESEITVQSISANQSVLSIKMTEGEVEEAAIFYDVHTFQPLKVVLQYRRSVQLDEDADSPYVQPRLEIVYTKTSLDGFGKERLATNVYLIKKGNQWALPSKYKDYELINNIHEFPEEN